VFLLRFEKLAAGPVTGEQLMTVAGMPTRAYQLNQKGANLKFIYPEEGVLLLAQNTFIMAKAPHPNAAKLWTDFILSETGQQILAEAEAMISGRSEFKRSITDYSTSIHRM
jgi:ABC-type Fe3+ transport system substrate-binding protein